MRKIENVVWRDAAPFYRRNIPKAVQALFGQQTCTFVALPSNRPPEIRKDVRLLNTEFDRMLAAARTGVNVGRFEGAVLARLHAREALPPVEVAAPVAKHLRVDDIEPLAQSFLAEQLAADEAKRFGRVGLDDDAPMTEEEHAEDRELLETNAKAVRQALARGDSTIIQATAAEYLESEGFLVELADKVFRQFARRLLLADAEALQLQIRRSDGESVPTPSKSTRSDNAALMFPALLESWHAVQQPEDKTVTEGRAAVRYMEQYLQETEGRSLSVNVMNKDMVSGFRNWMLKQVPNRHKNTGKPLHPSSVRKYMGLLNAMVNLHMADRECDFSNPFDRVKRPRRPRGQGRPRTAFDIEQLQQLYSHGPLIECRNSADGFERDAYWLTMCGPYFAGRLEELGQLLVRDIFQFGGRWFFRFGADTAGQSTKAENGDDQAGQFSRTVPMHRELVRLGFIDYVQAARKSRGREGRVFGYLKPDAHDVLTGHFSKWFGKLMDEAGLPDPRLTYHSLRHSWKHFARLCGIPKAVSDFLAGHVSGEVAESYRADEYPLEPLIEAMDAYNLEGLDLSAHLATPPVA